MSLRSMHSKPVLLKAGIHLLQWWLLYFTMFHWQHSTLSLSLRFKGGLSMKIIALNMKCNIFLLVICTVTLRYWETVHLFLICVSIFQPQWVQKALPVQKKKKCIYLKSIISLSTIFPDIHIQSSFMQQKQQ